MTKDEYARIAVLIAQMRIAIKAVATKRKPVSYRTALEAVTEGLALTFETNDPEFDRESFVAVCNSSIEPKS